MLNEVALLPPKETALTVYSADNGLDPYLAQIRAEIDSFVPDVTTKKGRDAIASIAYKVAKSKTALDNLGKDLVAELKDVPRKIDAERKRMRDTLDAWKDEVRKPLTDFELSEESRIAKHKENIQWFTDMLTSWSDSVSLQEAIDKIYVVSIDSNFEEFEAEAHRAKQSALENLNARLQERLKYESEQAELARLREDAAQHEQKEREEQIAREAAENARIAAEKAAADERQRLADEQARKDREAQAEIDKANREKLEAENARLRQQQESERAAAKAKQDAIDAEKKAKDDLQKAVEAEIKKHADAAEAERLETEKRERNKAHVGQKRKEAKESLMAACGVSEEVAKAIVLAITNGKIENVTINY